MRGIREYGNTEGKATLAFVASAKQRRGLTAMVAYLAMISSRNWSVMGTDVPSGIITWFWWFELYKKRIELHIHACAYGARRNAYCSKDRDETRKIHQPLVSSCSGHAGTHQYIYIHTYNMYIHT